MANSIEHNPYAHAPYGEVVTAMVTPFDEDGELDVATTQELVEFLVENGSHGIVVAGTTGEAPTITAEEQLLVIEAVLDVATVPVLAGAGSNNTKHAIEFSQAVTELPKFDQDRDGLLHVAPYYNRPRQAGIEQHFRSIAEAVPDTDIVLYDIPARTGVKIATKTILRLAEIKNIVGLKDAAGDVDETARLIYEAESDFYVYSGEDALNLRLRRVGAVGAISVASHWGGIEMAEMYRAEAQGDHARADELNTMLQSSYSFESNERWGNPEPAKAAMRALGFAVGECRPPMMPTGEEGEAAALAVFEDLPSRRDALQQNVSDATLF